MAENKNTLPINRAIDPDRCTACTVCMTACPVTAATRKFRGPKMTGPALARFRDLVPDEDTMLEYCTNCKLCDLACPSGVPISTLNMLAKNEYYKTHQHKQVDDMLAHSEKMAKLINRIPLGATVANMGMSVCKSFGLLPLLGLADDAPIPKYASNSFYSRFNKLSKMPTTSTAKYKVVFFTGCYINYNQPEVGEDLVKVYHHNNIEVAIDKNFICCGSPMVADGYLDEAYNHAKHNIALLKQWVDKGYDIITACTSCGLMLKQEYQELFKIAGLKECAKHMYDAIEYLVKLNDEGQLKKDFREVTEKFIYHAPCHVKIQARGLPSMELLPLIPNLQIEEADAGCCGLSGSYGFKADKRDISVKIGAELFERLKNSHADLGVCECGTCRLQMQSGSGIKTVHPLTVLKKAYRL